MSNVGRIALLLTPVALLARGVAFLVPVLIAHLFGVSDTTDAFFYALAVPTFVMVLIANALATTATPLLARVQEQEPEAMARFVGGAASWGGVLAVLSGGTMLAVLWPALPHITTFSPDTRALTWQFVGLLLPFMLLNGASALLKVTADVRGRFFTAALTPLLRGTAVMGGIIASRGVLGPYALPFGMLVGELVQVSWFLGVLASTGLRPVPTLALDHRIRGAMRDAAPILVGEVLVALNVLVDKAFAGTLDPGSVSLLEYADRARFIPTTALESTLLPVAFATWANLAARGDTTRFARQLDQSLRWVLAWTAPVLAGLYIGRHALVKLLFERGEFTATDTAVSADAFGWYIPGMWLLMAGTLAMRAHVVLRNLRLILVMGVVSVVSNGVLDALLLPFELQGLAAASSLVWTLVPLCYLGALWPQLAPEVSVRDWAWVAVIGAGCAAVAVGWELTRGPPDSVLDASLWVASVPCFLLLGLAAMVTRPPRRGTTP